jgi:hypothetical protein
MISAKLDKKQVSFMLISHTLRMNRPLYMPPTPVCLHGAGRGNFTYPYIYMVNHKQFLFLLFIFVCFENL